MRSRWLSITLGGLALGAVGYLGGRSAAVAPAEAAAEPREAAAAADQSRELLALQAQVRMLQAANAALARQNQGAEARAAPTPAPTADAPAATDPSADAEPAEHGADELAAEERARQERIRYFDELSRRVDTEPIDGAWRHRTEAPLGQLLAKHLGADVSVAEATCASSHCRVKLSHPKWPHLRAGATFDFDLARASLEVTEVTFDNREEGSTTLYFKRGTAAAAQLAESNTPEAR